MCADCIYKIFMVSLTCSQFVSYLFNCTCHIGRALHACYQSRLVRMQTTYSRLDQSERQAPPAPSRTPERSSNLSCRRRSLFTLLHARITQHHTRLQFLECKFFRPLKLTMTNLPFLVCEKRRITTYYIVW